MGGSLHYVSFWPPYWSEFFFILNWNFRPLSWLKPYKTGRYVWLRQCYYCANTGTFSKFCVAWWDLRLQAPLTPTQNSEYAPECFFTVMIETSQKSNTVHNRDELNFCIILSWKKLIYPWSNLRLVNGRSFHRLRNKFMVHFFNPFFR